MNNLILVRHGQSEFNLQRRFTGFYDVGLTPRGEAEAELAGKLIKNFSLSRIFRTTPPTRATSPPA